MVLLITSTVFIRRTGRPRGRRSHRRRRRHRAYRRLIAASVISVHRAVTSAVVIGTGTFASMIAAAPAGAAAVTAAGIASAACVGAAASAVSIAAEQK